MMPVPDLSYVPAFLPDGVKPRVQKLRSADDKFRATCSALACWTLELPLCPGTNMWGVEEVETSRDVYEAVYDMKWITEGCDKKRMTEYAFGVRAAYDPVGVPLLPDDKLVAASDLFSLEDYQRDILLQLCMPAIGAWGRIIAADCGTGKTRMGLAVAAALAGEGKVLIVAPLNAMGVWRENLSSFGLSDDQYMVVSMDSLHTAVGTAGELVIFDECHLLGAWNSERTKLAHKIRRSYRHGVCLTGTLLHRGFEDVLSMMDLALPGLSLFSNRWNAAAAFKCIERGKFGAKVIEPRGDLKAKFYAWVGRVAITCKIEDAVVMPERTEKLVKVAQPWRNWVSEITHHATTALAETGELPHLSAVLHKAAAGGVDEKLEWLTENYDFEADGQLVVFANYLESLDALEEWCGRMGLTCVRVDGSVTGKRRVEKVEEFQSGEARIFLGQMSAACLGIDLTAGRVSIGFDHCWKAADYAQMAARTYRRGQLHHCIHVDLTANSIQLTIINRLKAAQNFDSGLAEWQQARDAVKELHHA